MTNGLLKGSFFKSFRQIPFLIPITAQSTHHEPAKSLYAELPDDTSLSADIAMGFPPVDIPDCGPSVLAYAETQDLADAEADRITQNFIAAEKERGVDVVKAD